MDIFEASRTGNLSRVRELIASGVDVNARNNTGTTVLMYASRHGHIEVVRELIARGADVNLRNVIGYTTLMIASKNGHSEVVRELIIRGADVNAQNNYGETPYDLTNNQEIRNLLRPPSEPPLDVRLKPEDLEKYTNDPCGICLSKYNNQESIALVNPCNHIFHEECINAWRNQSAKCPKCNGNMISTRQLTINTTPGEPSQNTLFFGGYYNKLLKYQQKLHG